MSKKPKLTMMLSNWMSYIKACIEKHTIKDDKGVGVLKTKPKQQQPLFKYVNRSAKTQKSQPSISSHSKDVSPSEEGNSVVGSGDSLISKDKSQVEHEKESLLHTKQ